MRRTPYPWRTPSRFVTLVLSGAVLLSGCAGDGEPADDADTVDTAIDETATPGAPPETQAITVSDVGLATPESVLHDAVADVYLVSNIDGSPHGKDGNGFISRIRPDGSVETLRWIDGSTEGVTLNAPKGLAIKGDTLFVADIDSVRMFDRVTGAYHGARDVPGATFLNDLTVAADGPVYVSDSGLAEDFSSNGSDAVYRFDGDQAVAVVEGSALGSPNGIYAFEDGIVVVGFSGPAVQVLRPESGRLPVRVGVGCSDPKDSAPEVRRGLCWPVVWVQGIHVCDPRSRSPGGTTPRAARTCRG
ncbi:MAG: hypothetical protein P8177_09075 [Gemmatimonadota bacterium]